MKSRRRAEFSSEVLLTKYYSVEVWLTSFNILYKSAKAARSRASPEGDTIRDIAALVYSGVILLSYRDPIVFVT